MVGAPEDESHLCFKLARAASPSAAHTMRARRIACRRPLLGLAGICVLLAGAPSLLGGKKKEVVSRTVTGIVSDDNDNPIAGAVVEMTDLQTGKKLAIYTSEDGKYQFSDLDGHHDYHLQARHKEFSSEVRTASSFDASNRIILNFKLPKS